MDSWVFMHSAVFTTPIVIGGNDQESGYYLSWLMGQLVCSASYK